MCPCHVVGLLSCIYRKTDMATPESWSKLKDTRKRLQKCWDMDLDWSLFPEALKAVSHKADRVLPSSYSPLAISVCKKNA